MVSPVALSGRENPHLCRSRLGENHQTTNSSSMERRRPTFSPWNHPLGYLGGLFMMKYNKHHLLRQVHDWVETRNESTVSRVDYSLEAPLFIPCHENRNVLFETDWST